MEDTPDCARCANRGSLTPGVFACAECSSIICESCRNAFHPDQAPFATHPIIRIDKPETSVDGLWKQIFDKDSCQFYYFNLRSGDAEWERPAAFVAAEAPPEDGAVLAEHDGWQKVYDASQHQAYYYNPETQESAWEAPAGFEEATMKQQKTSTSAAAAEEAAEPAKATPTETSDPSVDAGRQEAAAQSSAAASPKEEEVAGDDTAGLSAEVIEEAKQWRRVLDEASGDYYYCNRVTNVTTWSEPAAVQALREVSEATCATDSDKQAAADAATAAAAAAEAEAAPAAEAEVAPCEAGEWRTARDARYGDALYYYHVRSKSVSWVKPTGPGVTVVTGCRRTSTSACASAAASGKQPGSGSRRCSAVARSLSITDEDKADRFFNWRRARDARTGCVYFYNRRTQEVSWRNPLLRFLAAATRASVSRGGGSSAGRARRASLVGGSAGPPPLPISAEERAKRALAAAAEAEAAAPVDTTRHPIRAQSLSQPPPMQRPGRGASVTAVGRAAIPAKPAPAAPALRGRAQKAAAAAAASPPPLRGASSKRALRSDTLGSVPRSRSSSSSTPAASASGSAGSASADTAGVGEVPFRADKVEVSGATPVCLNGLYTLVCLKNDGSLLVNPASNCFLGREYVAGGSVRWVLAAPHHASRANQRAQLGENAAMLQKHYSSFGTLFDALYAADVPSKALPTAGWHSVADASTSAANAPPAGASPPTLRVVSTAQLEDLGSGKVVSHTLRAFQTRMRSGFTLLKYPSRSFGKAHSERVWLDSDSRRVCVGTKGKGLMLSDITAVLDGAQAGAFKRSKGKRPASHCFSLVGGQRTLDFVADSAEDCALMASGFRALSEHENRLKAWARDGFCGSG